MPFRHVPALESLKWLPSARVDDSKFLLIEEPISPNPLMTEKVESIIARAIPEKGSLGPT
jgi:hypothetical protein